MRQPPGATARAHAVHLASPGSALCGRQRRENLSEHRPAGAMSKPERSFEPDGVRMAQLQPSVQY